MLPPYLRERDLSELIQRALAEDLVGTAAGIADLTGDVTTAATVPDGASAIARIRAKEAGVVAGLEGAARVFQAVGAGLSVRWEEEDGAAVEASTELGTVEGSVQDLLTAERLALNILQRMSGIATATRRMVEAARPHGAEILDTRKTAPGLRLLDKWAVRLGGGTNHRLGLYDLLLIKDNHLEAAGGIAPALERAHRYRADHEGAADLKIELETRTLDEVRAALDAAERGTPPDILLLDNMAHLAERGEVEVSMLREAVELVDGRFRTEASGGVTLEMVAAIAATGVDGISVGALTHSARALDLSMEMRLGA